MKQPGLSKRPATGGEETGLMEKQKSQETRSQGAEGPDSITPAGAARSEGEEPGHPTRSLLHHLRQDLPRLSPAERQIGEYVLANPRQALRLPTDQLAREVGVSQGTLSNFSQALGYGG